MSCDQRAPDDGLRHAAHPLRRRLQLPDLALGRSHRVLDPARLDNARASRAFLNLLKAIAVKR
jgi:hypothetical protein